MCAPAGSEYEGPRGDRSGAVRVWLLGGFRVSVGSRTITQDAWRLRKAAALVKLLALAPGHRLHREQVMDLLWPEANRRAASNNLRTTLHSARKVLDPTAAFYHLASEDESLVLCPKSDLWVDVDAFEEAAATARRSRDPAAYGTSIELYAGDLLPEDRYEVWAEARREELRRMFLDLLVEMSGQYEGRGEWWPAIVALRRAVAEEPVLEEAHVGLMRLYAFSGRSGQALVQYEQLRETLRRELGAEPSASVRALREEIASGRFPPQQVQIPGFASREAEEQPRHNLPIPRTSFVDRQRELTEIKPALATTRLLTLTGVGGSGKTRLALKVATDLAGAYPDGAWFVELATLSEPDLVPQTIADAVGAREQPGRPIAETVAAHLGEKRGLLILDNCEHLVDAAARMVDFLLASCPHLRVLATSREPLGVEGEVLFSVPPLPVPAALPVASGKIGGEDSVGLFVERARLRLPGFSLTRENARPVVAVCRRLDGLPLAIELAAARMGTLAADQMAQKLEHSLGLLSAGPRTAPSRQRTMRAAIGWSYGLLSEGEKEMFGRLSIFAGGFTLEAAEATCPDGSIEDEDVLNLVSDLVNKSLVVAHTTAEGRVRYRMLEPVRQYAREKLEESGEAETVLDRHAAFFLALAEEAKPELKRQRQEEWLERLEAEHDNFRAALSWLLEQGEAELGLRLSTALAEFWDRRGHFDEGGRWLEAVLAKHGPASASARAKGLNALGWLAQWQGDVKRAAKAAEDGLQLSIEEGIETRVTNSLRLLLGYTAEQQADYELATGLFEECLELGRKAGDEWTMAASLLHFGNVAVNQGENERGVQLYEEAIALCRKSGYTPLLADILVNLGYQRLLQGDHERATALCEEAIALYREQGYRYARLDVPMDNLGWAALQRGDEEQASVLHQESLLLCRQLGNRLVAAESLEGLACAAAVRGETQRSARLFGAADALLKSQNISHLPVEQALREPYLTAARSNKASWEEGSKMKFEEAIEYALSEKETSPPAPPAPGRPIGAELALLTRREQEVAALVTRGLTNRQIAAELSISDHTVANHVGNILRKLGMSSRSQLAVWVAEQHDPPSVNSD